MTESQKLDFLIEYMEQKYQEKLSVRSRQHHLIGLKWVYYNVARKYTTASLSMIAGKIGFDHATALHHLKSNPRKEWEENYNDVKFFAEQSFEESTFDIFSEQRFRELVNENINLKNENSLLKTMNQNSKTVIEKLYSGLNRTRKTQLLHYARNLLKIQEKFQAA